ncbi:zinc transporter, ZIP family [Desulfonatronum thiosulfatophilum]|uniref:Zinc transporter ZupT n=1 Tax=Desulfonatronum thiosulfatophilum TaxID=617002 RepID=A0A1G6B7C2_9BACT|nr:zinc transporter ZupT [Desulfonatronum thiosulfatophilum]SDB16303.1 zinc transporter, ZIP family [Desulfonatronum thiosulfatophilum]
MENNLLLAFALTTFAGLSTGFGSFLAIFVRRENKMFLAAALGFSAGVMIYISFVEMLPEALELLEPVHGEHAAAWLMAGAFFAGIFFIGIIDRLVPEYENPHHVRSISEMQPSIANRKLHRMGVFAALAIAIHNFPEGMVTFFATLHDPTLGVAIAIAVALHNIPEGIAIAVPVYYSTGSRIKAFWLSLLSGLAEPLGAVIGYLILRPFFSDTVFGLVFAGVAGIMVFISIDELFPAAKEYDQGHTPIYALIIGMMVMALSLLLLM